MSETSNSINSIPIEVTVVLGKTSMPVHQLLRMGRGAVIELDTGEDEEVEILANNAPIARGEVIVQGEKIAVSVSEKLMRSSSNK